MVDITGEVLRIIPHDGDMDAAPAELIIADAFKYWRVSLWDDRVARGIKVGDVLRIENARTGKVASRLHAGKYTTIIPDRLTLPALSRMPAQNLTVLAVARPEKGRVCIAGINERGEWIRPQGVYVPDVFPRHGEERFRNLCVSKIYVDAWHGRHTRREDRFFIYGAGIVHALSDTERKEFLEEHVDASVDAVFKTGRSLGLIKPRILHVYERSAVHDRAHETYIRFNFRDASGRIYRGWSCRCNAFYKFWTELKHGHRFTYRWRIHRYLRKNETYLAIGLTYTDYGAGNLEYGAHPMVVGVHVVKEG